MSAPLVQCNLGRATNECFYHFDKPQMPMNRSAAMPALTINTSSSPSHASTPRSASQQQQQQRQQPQQQQLSTSQSSQSPSPTRPPVSPITPVTPSAVLAPPTTAQTFISPPPLEPLSLEENPDAIA